MRWFWNSGVFLYILFCGFFVQLVLLPHYSPTLNDGVGLIKNSDASGFHQIAVDQANIIGVQGWSAWCLRPAGQSPAGIASALYVLTSCSKPWVMLPLNAVLWSFSAWILLLILRPFVDSDARAALCALPFVLAPTSLLFLTQIHKDPLIITGTLIVWFGLIRLFSDRTSRMTWQKAGRSLSWLIGGLILLWIGRPYSMFLSLLGCVFVGMVLLAVDLLQRRISGAVWGVLALSALLCFCLTKTKAAQEYSGVGLSVPGGVPSQIFRPSCLGPLDTPFRRMATMRYIYLISYPEARSKLDSNAILDSSWKVMSYVPRALQLLLLSPFPIDWIIPEGSNPFYAFAYMETLVRYLLIPGLFWICWRNGRELTFWAPWLFFVPWGVIYTITTPNLGTLMRVRFSLVMMLASLGAVGTFMLWDAWRERRRCR